MVIRTIIDNVINFIMKVCLIMLVVILLFVFVSELLTTEANVENTTDQPTQITVEIPGKEKDELYYAELEYYRIQAEYYQYQLDEYRDYREGMRN